MVYYGDVHVIYDLKYALDMLFGNISYDEYCNLFKVSGKDRGCF